MYEAKVIGTFRHTVITPFLEPERQPSVANITLDTSKKEKGKERNVSLLTTNKHENSEPRNQPQLRPHTSSARLVLQAYSQDIDCSRKGRWCLFFLFEGLAGR